MARTLRALSFALLPWFSLSGVAACGGHGSASAPSRRDAQLDAGGSPRTDTAPPLLDVPQMPSDAGVRTGSPEKSPEAGTRRAVCVPKAGPDEPDDDFADTNCDGIDGDVRAGVFVAPTGSDANPGSIDSPVRTLHRAVALATPTAPSSEVTHGPKAVYVCSGQYEESVVLDHVGVSLYGGYDCANGWKRRPDRAVVNPPSGMPLAVTGVATPVVFEWLAFRAADAAAPSESSVAASVFDSKSVRFSHVEFTAGNGADGVDGAPPVAPVMTLPTAIYGDPVTGDAVHCSTTGRGAGPQPSSGAGCSEKPLGGTRPYALCPDGALILGGSGGRGGNYALDVASEDGVMGLPQGTNYDGLPGAAGKPGAGGVGFGDIEAGLYVPTNGGRHGWPGRQGDAGHGGAGGVLGVREVRVDEITGETIDLGAQLRRILLRNENIDVAGSVGIELSSNLDPGNLLWSGNVCDDRVTRVEAQLVGDFLGDNDAEVYLDLQGGGVLRRCDTSAGGSFGLMGWATSGHAVIQAGVNTFGAASPNASLYGLSVASANWKLVIPGASVAPSNADLDLSKIEDIVFRVHHAARPIPTSPEPVSFDCLADVGAVR